MRMSAEDAHALAISSTAICSMSVPGAGAAVLLLEGQPEDVVLGEQLADVLRVLPVRSISAARGAIFSCASWRIMSRRSASSSGMA